MMGSECAYDFKFFIIVVVLLSGTHCKVSIRKSMFSSLREISKMFCFYRVLYRFISYESKNLNVYK